MIKTATHPSGDIITFNDNWHSYKSHDFPNKKFTSGTKFLGKFFAPFDKEKISKKYASKHNMKQKDVLTLWARKGEIGREVGTLVHNYLEKRLLGTSPSHDEATFHYDREISELALLRLPQADAAYEAVISQYEILGVEEVIASHTNDIAGMLDVRGRRLDNGKMALLDWKTNAKIDLSNPWQSGLTPIQHLDECSYNKYSLQLNIYERILVEEKYIEAENVERVIIHILDDSMKFYLCPDLQMEVGRMIETI